ncbi:hypothetical protein T484DRAFT_1792704, partial [Baffinella frigidus]
MAVDAEADPLATLGEELKRTASSPEGRARLAVLLAVKQAIKERGTPATASAHAAALMGSLSQTQDEDTTAAVVYVLSHTLSVLPLVVLRSKFAPLAEIITTTVGKHEASAAVARHGLQCGRVGKHEASAAVARHGLQCAYVVIGSQEGAAWKTPQMASLVEMTLSHAIDPRPKVRKAAQQNLVEFMSGEGETGAVARGVLETRLVALCTKTFKVLTDTRRAHVEADPSTSQKLLGMACTTAHAATSPSSLPLVVACTTADASTSQKLLGDGFSACTTADASTSQKLLGMVRDVAPRLSAKAVTSIVNQVLKLLEAADRTMLTQILGVLEAVVAPAPEEGGDALPAAELSAATVAKVISAALDKQPPQTGGTPDAVLAFLSLLNRAVVRLHALDAEACAALLPRVFGAATTDYFLPPGKHASDQLGCSGTTDYFLPPGKHASDQLAVASANLLSDLIDACVRRPMVEAAVAALPSGGLIDACVRRPMVEAAVAALPSGGKKKGAKRAPPASPLEEVVVAVEGLLTPRFHAVVVAVEGLLTPRFYRTLHCTLCVV